MYVGCKVIRFQAGSADLPLSGQVEAGRLLAHLNALHVDSFIFTAWSDEIIAGADVARVARQKSLAESRADSLHRFFVSLGVQHNRVLFSLNRGSHTSTRPCRLDRCQRPSP
jgi:hypothetical protein